MSDVDLVMEAVVEGRARTGERATHVHLDAARFARMTSKRPFEDDYMRVDAAGSLTVKGIRATPDASLTDEVLVFFAEHPPTSVRR